MGFADFPEKLHFLFKPAPYKVAYGGRYGFKSWGFARALLLKGVEKPLRILCAREVQLSIRASVHQLLADQIQLMGLGSKYTVLDHEIRGKNGTNILFTGLSQHTVNTLKSFEKIDICWVEEGQTITLRSWQILDPTIRTKGSEIWVSFNPHLDTDPTYEMFVTHPPPGAVVVKMNWRDAPEGWLTDEIIAKRLHSKKTDPKNYANIYEGECLPAVEGAIYFDEMQAMKRENRIRPVPYDPMLKAHVVIDLGFNDQVSVSVVQKQTSEIRFIRYIEENARELAGISADLREYKYNWGKVWLPHADGFSRGSSGQKSADMIMRALGWSVAKKSDVSDLGVESGIRATRMAFPRFYVDETNCARLLECWRRYRRHINKQTFEAGGPLHDEFCHGADNGRYVATNIDQMTNDTDVKRMPYVAPHVPMDPGVGY